MSRAVAHHARIATRRQGRPARAVNRLRPVAEELEDRCLLAFDLHNGILRETFDEQDVTDKQLLAGWDDDEYVPATNGSGQNPQLVSPAIPLFHHQVTIIPNGSLYNDAAAGTLKNEGDTTIAANPFIPRALQLFAVTDTITFPDVNPQNNEAVSIAALDIERGAYGPVSATFVGTNDTETLTDTILQSSSTKPVVISQGSPGSGPIGVAVGFSAPTTRGWDTLAATSDDIGLHGKALGPITEIDLVSSGSEMIDNVRVFVGFAVPPTNSPPNAMDDTGYTTAPGQPISIPVMANDSDPDGDPIHLVSVGPAKLGTAVIDPSNPDQVLYTPAAPFVSHGPDTFPYTIADTYGATATAHVTVLVNTPPYAPDITFTIPHDTMGSFSKDAAHGLLASGVGDADNDPITLSAPTALPALSLNQDGSFTFTESGLVTAYSFGYTVSDPYTKSSGTISLVPENKLPPDPVPETYNVVHGYVGTLNVPAARGVFSNNPETDSEGDRLTPIVFEPPASGTVTFNQAADGSYDGSFTYTPKNPSGLVVEDTFQYALSDGYSHSDPATVHLVVPNQPPRSVGFERELSHDQIGKLILLGNLLDSAYVVDPENDPLTLAGPITASFGQVIPDLTNDGGYSYFPNTQHLHPAPGPADANSGKYIDTVSYWVFDTYGDGTQVTITLAWDDFDPTAPRQLFYVLKGDEPPGQPLELSANALQDSYADRVTPPDFESVGPNDPEPWQAFDPDANKDNLKPVDPDNLPLKHDANGNPIYRDIISGFQIVDPPTAGQILSMDSDGDFTYQAGANFSGEDSFSYVVNDGFALSPKGYVTIRADFDTPELVTTTYTITENGTLGAGTPGNTYTVEPGGKYIIPSSTDVPVTVPGVISFDKFPNGAAIAPYIRDVQVLQRPMHALYFGSSYGFIGDAFKALENEQLENDGGFFYVPEPGFTGSDSFTYYVDYGLNADPNKPYATHSTEFTQVNMVVGTVVILVLASPNSQVSVQDSAPDHGTIALASPPGTGFVYARATENPDGSGTPPGEEFPFGFLSFAVTGLPIQSDGAATTVTLTLPVPVDPGFVYYKYGPFPGYPSPTWYNFTYDGTTGAETWLQNGSLAHNIVILHFVDGQRGDDNIDSPDGTIGDAGGPAYSTSVPAISVSGPSKGYQGLSLPAVVSMLNPGLLGSSTVFSYRINWGDGSPIDTMPASLNGSSAVAARHVFARTGRFVIQVIAVTPAGVRLPTAESEISVYAPPEPMTARARRNVFVATLYEEILGRNPESKGLNYWNGVLRAGASQRSVAARIFRSQERRELVLEHDAPPIRLRTALDDAALAERQVHPLLTSHPAGPINLSLRRRAAAHEKG